MSEEPLNTPSEGTVRPAFDVFISHASADKDVARLLARRLESEGLRVWFDESQLQPGQDWQQRIRDAVEQSRVCLILLSSNALPSKPWVSQEWSTIQECSWRRRDFTIFPVKLDDASTPPFLRNWQSLRCDRRDSAELDQAVRQTLVLVVHGSASRRESSSEIDRSATAERFSELEQALVKGRDTATKDEDATSDG